MNPNKLPLPIIWSKKASKSIIPLYCVWAGIGFVGGIVILCVLLFGQLPI